MNKTIKIPKIAGISIAVHWTFSLLIAWIIITNLMAGLNALEIGWMILFILSLFACVTLHELGHALAARKFGIKTKDITLYPIGGIARLEKIPDNPKQELIVALAGPLVNVVIMVLLLPFIMQLVNNVEGEPETLLRINHSNFLPMLGFLNVWLAVFNLIPAFPMDGGRVLRALLSMKLDRVRATEIASSIGKMLAVGFVFFGLYTNPFLIFIGLFIFLGAHAESEMVKTYSALEAFTARNAMMTRYTSLDKTNTIADAIKMLLDGEAKNFLITDNGQPFGIVSRDSIIRGISTVGDRSPLEMIASRNLVYFDVDAPLADIYKSFYEDKVPVVLVSQAGRLAGIIDAENIAELIMISQAKGKVN
ncbi:MAG TPA: site-2 protease family protein [Cyclobacteriaceae bacterium]|nr:site-2 protease family protein [Cyclobacteriaceae bacterium]